MRIRPIVTVAAAIAFAAGSVPAQCVMNPIRVERIEGQLLFGFQNKFRILDKAEVHLLDRSNRQTVFAAASVGRDGRFAIPGTKPGKFILAVRSEGLIPAYVDVTIIRSKPTRSKQVILVILGADATRECGGATISVRSVADVDQVLSTATRPEE